MATVAPHDHPFGPGDWPFVEAHNTAAFTTSRHLRDGQPILFVSHDSEGEWQFLCGDICDDEECLLICLACAYLRDTTVGELADMPAGWQARRESIGAPWQRFPVAKESEHGGEH